MTAKMKTMMASTKHRLPSASSVRAMMLISKFNVGHDLASLNTRNCSAHKYSHSKCVDLLKQVHCNNTHNSS